MMKIKRLLLSAFLSISLISGFFVSSIPVYAVSLSDINAYFSVQDKFYQILRNTTDIITTQEHQTSILNKMYDILEENGYNGSRSGEGLESSGNVTINSSGDVVLSVDLQNAIREAAQDEIDSSGIKYVYSGNSANFINAFSNQEHYHAYLNFLDSHKNDFVVQFNYGTGELYVYENFPDLVYNSYSSSNCTYVVIPYYNWSVDYSCKVYTYDSNSQTYVTNGNINTSSARYLNALGEIGASFSSNTNRIVALNTTQYKMYMTVNDMRLGSEGLQPYYVGNDFSTTEVTNTQTITDSMLNSSISYSNISDYVNNYYVTNTTYPSSQDVYNYINNYDGSGGSGGSGGSDDDDDNNNFNWGFLGAIGDFIGGLLDALSGIVSGILSALTGIIDLFIGTENPETGQREGGLPNIVGNLIEYFLPFLPPEFLTLIELSLFLALVLGVIRLIRGH